MLVSACTTTMHSDPAHRQAAAATASRTGSTVLALALSLNLNYQKKSRTPRVFTANFAKQPIPSLPALPCPLWASQARATAAFQEIDSGAWSCVCESISEEGLQRTVNLSTTHVCHDAESQHVQCFWQWQSGWGNSRRPRWLSCSELDLLVGNTSVLPASARAASCPMPFAVAES